MQKLTINPDQHSAMLYRGLASLKTSLATLVPWGPFSIDNTIDLQGYHARFNLTSSRVLRARLEIFSASLEDFEDVNGYAHPLDDEFFMVENVTQAAQKHLLDVPFTAMDPLHASGGDLDMWKSSVIVAQGGSNLPRMGAALAPFFTN